jgi:hypothetical protein
MSSSEPEPSTAGPTTGQVLAAVQRAVRHAPRPGADASTAAVLAHLALAPRSAAGRRARGALERLEAVGMLTRSPAHGRTGWRLAARGRTRLAALRTGGAELLLPESPQHRAWREARAAAEREVSRFRSALSGAARELETLAGERGPPPASDAILELAVRVQSAARRLASALHCLHEWREPDDASPDVDTFDEPFRGIQQGVPSRSVQALRAGRRNVRLWAEARD